MQKFEPVDGEGSDYEDPVFLMESDDGIFNDVGEEGDAGQVQIGSSSASDLPAAGQVQVGGSSGSGGSAGPAACLPAAPPPLPPPAQEPPPLAAELAVVAAPAPKAKAKAGCGKHQRHPKSFHFGDTISVYSPLSKKTVENYQVTCSCCGTLLCRSEQMVSNMKRIARTHWASFPC